MSLANILKLAKGDEEERIAMSLKVPASIKMRLEEFARENNISVNALINAMIKNGFEDVPVNKELYLELIDLEKRLSSYLLNEKDGGELFDGYMCNPGIIDNEPEMLSNLISRVKSLRKIID